MSKKLKGKMKMNEQQVFKLFIRFLKDERIYSKFMRNFRKAEGEKTTFEKFCKQQDLTPITFILCPFAWADTKEGHVFWSKVDNQWENYCNTHDIDGVRYIHLKSEVKK